ncbi:tRNA pseudouridine(55) synthase TruB [Williamsia serinedens]|uniref:tRNA pseudouridine synthase B n=1 Tax=Williamsia serinedens TaxID=391736 RepID=A0ABT1GZM8_9NOCA|nr:tRNA pseudouridine(55) synthase TruB [Williamsia serinedens]MCP2159007.1 tRNA pseudouridine55 synthase [Williamsia serinedens]
MSGRDRRADAGAVIAAGLVLVDKPAGITSHDVVARCRKAFSTRKVGHAGTLDPMATGVLVIGVERATKLLGLLSLTTKSYTATIRLGAGSDTDDADGTLGDRADVTHLDREAVVSATRAFVGDIDQVPARVSAIKVDGRRAHALMREGVDVELPSRRVTVSRFDVLDTRATDGWFDVDVEVDCSSGTYIRSLARDLGAALGVGGHLTVLRRTAVGPFTIDRAVPLDALEEDPRMSLAIDDAIAVAFEHRTIDDEQAESISQGRWLEPIGMSGVHAAVTADGRVIALLQEKGRRAASVMVVRPATLR